jgi:hypothetical protein
MLASGSVEQQIQAYYIHQLRTLLSSRRLLAKDSHMYSDRIDLLDPCAYPQSMDLYNPRIARCYPVPGGLPTKETLRNLVKCCTGNVSPWCHHQTVWYICVTGLRPLYAYTVFHMRCRLQQRRFPGAGICKLSYQEATACHISPSVLCNMSALFRRKKSAELVHP